MASSNRKPESLQPEELLPENERTKVQEMTSNVKTFCSSSSDTNPEQYQNSSSTASNDISGTSFISSHLHGKF